MGLPSAGSRLRPKRADLDMSASVSPLFGPNLADLGGRRSEIAPNVFWGEIPEQVWADFVVSFRLISQFLSGGRSGEEQSGDHFPGVLLATRTARRRSIGSAYVAWCSEFGMWRLREDQEHREAQLDVVGVDAHADGVAARTHVWPHARRCGASTCQDV